MSKYRTSSERDKPVARTVQKPVPVRANPIHSVLTSLPVIMLLAGLGYYYSTESKQQNGELILSQSVEMRGHYRGTSAQSKRPGAQRMLWLQSDAGLRGYRVTADQVQALDGLEIEDEISLAAAPRVVDSKVLWIYRLSTAQHLLLAPSADDGLSGEQPVLIGDENGDK